jgi:hypothetical protein
LEPVQLGSKNPVNDWVKKMKPNSLKKLFTVILTTLFLVGFNLTPAQAVTFVSCSGGGTFSYTGTTVDSISGQFCIGTAVIPNTITIISQSAFADATRLTAVTIGTSVIRIDDFAFSRTRLSTVTIPNNVQTLGNGVFQSNPFLSTVTIGTGLTAMGALTFEGSLGNLTSVYFEGNAPTVGAQSFDGAGTMAVAVIKYTATGFGASGSDWNGLDVTRNEKISCGTSGTFTNADYSVTGNDSCVGTVNIPSGVTSIATDAFRGNLSITSVVIPGTVLTISDGAFWGANGITSLTIGIGVTTIGNRAFNGVNKITSLNIPNSVTTIGTSAFSGTSLLASLTLGNQLTTIGLSAFAGSRITSLIIPDSVTTIGGNSFEGITTLTSLTLGNSVTTIGENAFTSTSLTTLNIPNSVTTIEMGAFERISTLSSVTIGNSVTTIESDAFDSRNIGSVTFLGNAPASVSDAAFNNADPPATANVAYNATGFPANGSIWKRLSVVYGSAPASDSGSTTASAPITTPTVIKTADAIFNLKNKKYLSKNAMKTKLSINKSFKRVPEDLYKYSIFKASKKTCVINENYVTRLKKTGTCDLYATRTTTKGVKYKYWVQINYTK